MQLSYCAEQVRRFDNDRFLCGLFAPESRNENLFALYAFNSEIARARESVSEPILGQIRLQWWRDAIDAAYAGKPPHHMVAEALACAIQRHSIARDRLDRLIDGRERDMDDAPFSDIDALNTYAVATSSTLTELALEVLGAAEEAAITAAHDIGIAWALIGLMRAIPHHARQGRSFLPESLVISAGLDMKDVMATRATPALQRAVEQITDEAAVRLKAARAIRRDVPDSAIPALLHATLADAYMKELSRVRYNPFALRHGNGGTGRKIRLAVAAFRHRY
ncbi:MAG: squalene/phytoene synthase family protein [Rhodospirillales bacterium]|nr:squalene/phytoene synthase family protein [Rhodospirillales bacterium]